MSDLEKTITDIQKRIEDAKVRANRQDESVLLMGVTKTIAVDRINEAINCGIRCIGENKAQELLEKYEALNKTAQIHFIGHLQTNKVKYIIDKVSLIHSVDSYELAKEIDKQAKKIDKIQDILLQVNIAGDEAKFGVLQEDVCPLIDKIQELNQIRVMGLMTIPFLVQDAQLNRKHYHNLHNLFIDIKSKNYHNTNMVYLSMGMSNDFEVAVEEGATIVRIGSGMFGKRDYTL